MVELPSTTDNTSCAVAWRVTGRTLGLKTVNPWSDLWLLHITQWLTARFRVNSSATRRTTICPVAGLLNSQIQRQCCKVTYEPSSSSPSIMPSSHHRHGQDKTVSSCPCRWCELSWWQVKTVFSSPQYIWRWTVLLSPVCGVNKSWPSFQIRRHSSLSSTDEHVKVGVASLGLWQHLAQKVIKQYLPHSEVVAESDIDAKLQETKRVRNFLVWSPIQFTPLTRTRQDSLVLSVSAL